MSSCLPAAGRWPPAIRPPLFWLKSQGILPLGIGNWDDEVFYDCNLTAKNNTTPPTVLWPGSFLALSSRTLWGSYTCRRLPARAARGRSWRRGTPYVISEEPCSGTSSSPLRTSWCRCCSEGARSRCSSRPRVPQSCRFWQRMRPPG